MICIIIIYYISDILYQYPVSQRKKTSSTFSPTLRFIGTRAVVARFEGERNLYKCKVLALAF